jgi:excisionase family DNA binding protein
MGDLISAVVVAKACGVSRPETVLEWVRKGIVPAIPYGKQVRFNLEAVQEALRAYESRPPRSSKRCSVCGEEKPLDQFRVRKHRSGNVGPSDKCHECHRAYNRSLRERDAARAGRSCPTAEERHRRSMERKAQRRAKYEAWLAAERARPKQTHEEMIRRSVARQRERYNSDPEYKAKIKAKKIKRKRAIEGAFIEPVNHMAVAERDRWLCGICGGVVTRETWSLDHVVPLSKGGEHSYANVTLAHRRCNSARGNRPHPSPPTTLSGPSLPPPSAGA